MNPFSIDARVGRPKLAGYPPYRPRSSRPAHHRRRPTMRLIVAALFFAMSLAATRSARATTSVCTWVSGGVCNFGNTYSQASGQPVDVTGTMVFNCTTVGSAVTIIMYAGTSGSESTRSFSGYTSDYYQLYTDSARTNYFGSTTGHTIVISSPVLGNNTVTYYGRVPASQAIATGGYTDNNWSLLNFGGSSLGTMAYEYLTVNGTCSVAVSSNIAFGSYDSIVANHSSPLNATGGLSVNCTTYLPYTIEIDQGSWSQSGSTDSVPLRRMFISSWRLNYYLYQDSGRTQVWGNTSSTGVTGTGTGASQAYTVYGQMPAGQNTKAGNYSDTLTITVTF